MDEGTRETERERGDWDAQLTPSYCSWSVHSNFGLYGARSKLDFKARKLKCPLFMMVYQHYLKRLSHEKNFKRFYKNLQKLA
jgi:hypothetical protein